MQNFEKQERTMNGPLTQKLPRKVSCQLSHQAALLQRARPQSHAAAQTAALTEQFAGEPVALTTCWQLEEGHLVMRWQVGQETTQPG
jgi:hypothetical protein